ncbi:MAG TPA: MG2 domain-containing protein, partial [Steroidobacteraceae bacterium]
GEERRALLAQRRQLGYAYFRILWKDGEVTPARVRDDSLRAAESQVVVVQCQRRLPPAAVVELVWGQGVATLSGAQSTADQRLAFRVRPDFTARIECTRSNPQSGCLPFKPVEVRFTSPVPRQLALGLRLIADGRTIEPVASSKDPAPTVDAISFRGPFPPSSTVRITLAAGLHDDAGRSLSNANRFPVEVRIDEFPPLAKFSGTFGILEARAGAVLPVTLRSLDEPAAGAAATLPARRLRVGADPAAIASWLRRVEAAQESRGEYLSDPKTGKGTWKELTGSESVFTATDAPTAFDITKPAGAQEFEVVGLPLPDPGLHVVEIASRRLGRSLLGTDRPRYVATAALVTNLAVHFKWGRESSLVWVTRLDDGKPVADAAVTIVGACDGSTRWSGKTGRDGIARIEQTLGEPMTGNSCDYQPQRPLLALAQAGNDFSFALSWWTEGIAPWDFGLDVGSADDADLTHTVFDRALFRPGETVAMKHFLRRHLGPGIAMAEGLPATRKVLLQHRGSDQQYQLQAQFDVNGIATQQWAIPVGARTGQYDVRVADARGEMRSSGSFKVEDFRLPTMRADVNGPAQPQVQPQSVPIDLHVAYLAGGGAGGLPVTLRTYVDRQTVSFRGYDDYLFGGTPVKEGIESLGGGTDEDVASEDDGNDAAPSKPKVRVLPLTLDASGAARVDVAGLPQVAASSVLTAELEYPDSNGERLTATSYIRLHPAAINVGIRREGWVGTAEKLRFRVVVLDLEGRPVARKQVRVAAYQSADYSYRKRLIGGFYAYETTRETRKLPTVCSGRTDVAGLLSCEVAPGVSGQVLMRAETKDSAGRIAGATTSAWVMGADDWWFGGTTGDR